MNTRLLRFALAFTIALSPALPAIAGPSPDGRAQAIATAGNVHIENFGQVTGKLFRGAEPSARDFAGLAALGVKTIIDLQEADGNPNEPQLAAAAGMKYYKIAMSTHRPPTAEQLDQFFRLVNNSAGDAVYLHCKGGRHRTGVMAAAYRMTFDGWTPDQAFSEMKRYQFGADMLHPEFKKYVYSFDAKGVRATAAAATQQQQ